MTTTAHNPYRKLNARTSRASLGVLLSVAAFAPLGASGCSTGSDAGPTTEASGDVVGGSSSGSASSGATSTADTSTSGMNGAGAAGTGGATTEGSVGAGGSATGGGAAAEDGAGGSGGAGGIGGAMNNGGEGGAGASSTGTTADGSGGNTGGSDSDGEGGAENMGGEGGGDSDGEGGDENMGGEGGGDPEGGEGGDENMGGEGGAENMGGEGGSDSESDADPLSPGCGTDVIPAPPKNEQQQMEIGGDPRYYLMDVPANVDNQTPLTLVLALHGFDMNNIAVVDLFNFTQRSGGTAITVWPQGEGPHPGTESHWGDGVLESTWASNDNNYTFLSEIIRDIGERYCIDTERIFITGFSMGGFFTNQIACAHSDWFRAFAPVAGGGPQACADASVNSAIMVQHGTEDPIVELSSGESSRDFWVSQNGCEQTSTQSLNNCAFYDGCAEDSPVAWCTGAYDHYIPEEVASNAWSFFDSF